MTSPYVYTESCSLEHYRADAYAIRCFDNRFWKPFKHFLKSRSLNQIDLGSFAGGAKVLASPEKEGDRDFVLREIEKSIRLHHTPKVMLFTHSDCGAYGGLQKFGGDAEKEFTFHQREHKNAHDAVQTRIPNITVESYFLDANGIQIIR